VQPFFPALLQQHPPIGRFRPLRADDHVYDVLPGQERLFGLCEVQGGFEFGVGPGDGRGRLPGTASGRDTAGQGQDRCGQADGSERNGKLGLSDDRSDRQAGGWSLRESLGIWYLLFTPILTVHFRLKSRLTTTDPISIDRLAR
jgi:hypothetical protein